MVAFQVGSTALGQLKLRRSVVAPPKRAMPVNYLSNLHFGAKLEVGMRLLITATQTPYKEGEFMIPFGSQVTITDDQLRSPHLYVPFRWSSKAPKVTAAQWQVVQTPSSYGLENWEYPAGIVARGMVASLPKKADDASYFVVDFGPIYNRPKEFRLQPRSKVATRKRRPTSHHSLAVPKTGFSAVKISPAMRLQQVKFTASMATLAEHRMYYVRLVLLGAGNKPIGLSAYVPIRSAPPSSVTIYPGSLPQNQLPPAMNCPKVEIVGYDPPKYFNPDDLAHHFIVLSNCPKILLDTMHWKVGQHIYIPPKRDEGIDSIGDAAGAAFDAISDLVNWVSNAWSDIQAGFVDGICGGNGACKSLAGPALKIGLMYVGIPPDLPSSSELCSMGKDYIADYVATQAGIPPEVVRAGIDKMADVVNNPPGGAGGTFLWPDPAYQDRPPCVHVKIRNTSGKPTDGTVLWLLYGSTQGDSATYPPWIPTYLDTQTPLPPLEPGESLDIPIFLTPNPETFISHGADRVTDYQGRRIAIYDKGGKPLYFGKTNWHGGAPDK
jgi:hypothetical protein